MLHGVERARADGCRGKYRTGKQRKENETVLLCTILKNTSSSALSDIKHETQLSVLYSDKARIASVLNGLKNERYCLFICEVIFKINVI